MTSMMTVSSVAQDLGERLRNVGNSYAGAYVEPLVDGLGADLNSGLFQSVHFGRAESGLDVYLGVRAMAMPLGAGDDSFSLTYRGTAALDVRIGPSIRRLRLPATYTVEDAPTFFGAEDPGVTTVHVRHDTTISYLGVILPVSIDTTFQRETIGGVTEGLNALPFAAIQGGIGTLFGTSLIVRWLPTMEVEDLGDVGYFGFGLRHQLDRYLPPLPIRLAVQGVWQRARVTDPADDEVLTATTFGANIEASRRVGPLTLFGGIQTEEARLRVQYDLETDIEDEDVVFPIDLDLRAQNRMRLVLGADLEAGPVHLYGDVNLGSRTSFSVGLGLVFNGPSL
ncbi:MAG TPA: DUF6588 family protein [Rhodothermales bacterium]|nr:DUF6588 family protein [Rhodothermales bacterium]